MKREIDIPEVLDKAISKFISSHSKFNKLSEFAVDAFEKYLKSEGFLQSNISSLDRIEKPKQE